MIRRVLQAAARHFDEANETVANASPDEPDARDVELERLRRERDGLIDVLGKMERQRDEWKARFMEQWRQHGNAQALLEQHIQLVGTTLVRAVEMLNEERKKNQLEPVTAVGLRELAKAGKQILRTSEQYVEAMEKLAATAPKRDEHGQILEWSSKPCSPDLDGAKERERVLVGGC